MFQLASTLRNNDFAESFLRRYRKQKLNKLSDTHFLDETGDYHGTQYDKSVFDFDGSSGLVNVSNSLTGNLLTTSGVTFCCWAKAEGGTGARMLFAYRDSSNPLLQLSIHSTNGLTAQFRTSNSAITTTTDTSSTETVWNHYAVVWDFQNETQTIYINGLEVDSDSIAVTGTLTSAKTFVGGFNAGGSNMATFDGKISNVVISNSVFSDENVLENYQGFYVDGSQYNFEERSGTTAFDATTNGHDGSLVGGVTHTTVKAKGIVNHTNNYGYSLDGLAVVPRLFGSDLDAQGNESSYKGKVCLDMLLVNSGCVELDGISGTEAVFNFDCTGLTITSHEGTATPNFDTANDKITFTAGTFYNLVLSNGYHFPICEGFAVTSYAHENVSKKITWNGGVTWGTQNSYHYNIRNGYAGFIPTGAGDEIRTPIGLTAISGCLFSGNFYAKDWHNGAETQLQMQVFRESLGDSEFHYDQSDLSSNEILFSGLIDSNNEVFVTKITSAYKTNVETFIPANSLFKLKRQNNGFRKNRNSLHGSVK